MIAAAAFVTVTSDADFVEFVLAFVAAVTMLIILRVLLILSSTIHYNDTVIE